MTPIMRAHYVLMLAAPLLLAGCGWGSQAELQQWMNEARQTMKPRATPVPESKQFAPYVYDARTLMDPFDGQKIAMALARQQQARPSASAIKPDLDRRRDVLESFPLDQIRMVGTLNQAGTTVALVEANGGLHMVRVGSYMGQNFGLVTRITESEVQVKEIVQDSAGEWTERPARLELQEGPATAQQGRRR